MSSVLDRSELEQSPLADLHLLANELGVDGFRRLRREELIDAILSRQTGENERAPETADEEPEAEAEARGRGRGRARRRRPQAAPGPAWRPWPRTRPLAPTRTARPTRTPATTRRRSSRASWSCWPTGPGSCACRRPTPPTTTSTSRPRRSSAASSCRATGSPVRCARRGAPSASRRWCASTRSTAARPTRSPRAPASRICRSSFPTERFELGSEDPTVKAIEWLTPFGRGSRVVIAGPAACRQERGAAAARRGAWRASRASRSRSCWPACGRRSWGRPAG